MQDFVLLDAADMNDCRVQTDACPPKTMVSPHTGRESDTDVKLPIDSVDTQYDEDVPSSSTLEHETEPKLPREFSPNSSDINTTDPKSLFQYSRNNINTNQRHSGEPDLSDARYETCPKQLYSKRKEETNNDFPSSQHTTPATHGAPPVVQHIHTGDNHVYMHEPPSDKLDSIDSDLKNRLRQHANIFAEKSRSPIELEKALKYVSLEVSTKFQRDHDDNINHTSRKELAKVYEPPLGDVQIHELFAKAELANRLYSSRKGCAGHHHTGEHEHHLGIVGPPGVGKSTVAQILCKMILDKEICENVEYIFCITINQIDLQREYNNALEFLLISCLPDFRHAKETDAFLLEKLSKSQNVVVIIDGIDEANVSLSTSVKNCNLFARHTGEVILKNLLQPVSLPLAFKVVIGRDSQFFQLPQKYRPKFVVVVNGFSIKAQEEICEQICGEHRAQVQSYLHENPNIASYGYVPVNCIITMETLRRSQQSSNHLQIKSPTHVFTISFNAYINSEHFRENQDVRNSGNIALLAWNGFAEKKYIFGVEDFAKAQLTQESGEAFLSIRVDPEQINLRHVNHVSCFAHLTLQEYHAARYAMLFMPFKVFVKHRELFCSVRSDVVMRSMFGLCNKVVYNDACKIPSNLPILDYDKKKKCLTNLAKSCLKDVLTLNSIDTVKFLQICSWLYEANDPDITSSVCSMEVPNPLEISGLLLPSDAASLVFYLTKMETALNIKLGTEFANIRFRGNALFTLLTGIKDCNNLKVTQFHATSSTFDDNGIKAFHDCIAAGLDELRIELWTLTDDQLKSVTEAIAKSTTKIRVANFSYTKLGESGAKHFGTCISNIEDAIFVGCDVNGVGAGYLAQGLTHRMKSLDLQDNPIGDEGAYQLAPFLHMFDKLLLERCGIGPNGAIKFGDFAATLQTPMEYFNISCNKIQDDGLIGLLSGLSNMRKLGLWDCGFTEEGTTRLGDKLKDLACPMKFLNIGANKIGNGATALADALSSVQQLNLSQSHMPEPGVKYIKKKYKRLRVKPEIEGLGSMPQGGKCCLQ